MRHLIITVLCFANCCMAVAQHRYTLHQCKQEALKNNIAIRKADNNIRSAEEQHKEAYTNYFPNVSASGAYFHANKALVEGTVNPAEYIPAEATMMIPAEIAGMFGNPIAYSMMKHGTRVRCLPKVLRNTWRTTPKPAAFTWAIALA